MKFLLILLLICNTASAKDFDTTPQVIKSIDTPKSYKTVAYDERYTFAVPVEFGVKRVGARHMFILSPMNKTVFGVLELPTLLQPEDYGLDITKRELLSAFYDKNYVSNKDINTTRKEIFKSSSNIIVYKRDGFMFFREDRYLDNQTTITTSINDDVLTSTFPTDKEEIIMNFIKSIKVK